MISRPSFRISQAIAITLAASAALQVLGALSLVLRPAAARDVVHLGLVEAFTFVLGVLALLAIEGRDEPLAASLGLRRAAIGHVALGVGLGPLLHLPAATTEALVARWLPTPEENVAARIALLTGDGPLRVALIAAVVAVVGPLVEELFFRGALYGALRRGHSLRTAAITAGVCFVIGHLDPYLWAPIAVVSAVASHLRAASGSLLPPLALHVTFNGTSVVLVTLGRADAGDDLATRPGPAVLGVAATLAGAALVEWVARRSPDARRGRAEDAA